MGGGKNPPSNPVLTLGENHTIKNECKFESNNISLSCNVQMMIKKPTKPFRFLKYYLMERNYKPFDVKTLRDKLSVDPSNRVGLAPQKKVENKLGSKFLMKSQFGMTEKPVVNEPKAPVVFDEKEIEKTEQPKIEEYAKAKTTFDGISNDSYQKFVKIVDQKKNIVQKQLTTLTLDDVKNYEFSIKTCSFSDMLVADLIVHEQRYSYNSDIISSRRLAEVRKEAFKFSEKMKWGFENGKVSMEDYYGLVKRS